MKKKKILREKINYEPLKILPNYEKILRLKDAKMYRKSEIKSQIEENLKFLLDSHESNNINYYDIALDPSDKKIENPNKISFARKYYLPKINGFYQKQLAKNIQKNNKFICLSKM